MTRANGLQPYLAVATTNTLYAWNLSDSNMDGRLDSVLTVPLPAALTPWNVAALDTMIVAYNGTATLVYGLSGVMVQSYPGTSTFATLGNDWLLLTQGNVASVYNVPSATASSTITVSRPIVAQAGAVYEPGSDIHVLLTGSAGAPWEIFDLTFTSTGASIDHLFPVSRFFIDDDDSVRSLVLADVNKDGRKDILVVTNTGRVLAFDRQGLLLDGFPRSAGAIASGMEAAAVVRSADGMSADILGIDTSGVLHVVGTSRSTHFQVSGQGRGSAALGLVLSGTQGRLAAVTSDRGGRIGLWDLEQNIASADLLWDNPRGDASGRFYVSTTTPGARPLGTGLLPAERTYNWPNPAYGGETFIRYYSDASGSVTVDIFDLAGDKITQLSGTAVGGQDGELRWDLSSIQTGVYLARIKLDAGGKSQERVIKIAVIK